MNDRFRTACGARESAGVPRCVLMPPVRCCTSKRCHDGVLSMWLVGSEHSRRFVQPSGHQLGSPTVFRPFLPEAQQPFAHATCDERETTPMTLDGPGALCLTVLLARENVSSGEMRTRLRRLQATPGHRTYKRDGLATLDFKDHRTSPRQTRRMRHGLPHVAGEWARICDVASPFRAFRARADWG